MWVDCHYIPGLGGAIRVTVAVRRAHPVASTSPKEFASKGGLLGGGSNRPGIYAVADGVAPETFEAAIDKAKEEGDLSPGERGPHAVSPRTFISTSLSCSSEAEGWGTVGGGFHLPRGSPAGMGEGGSYPQAVLDDCGNCLADSGNPHTWRARSA